MNEVVDEIVEALEREVAELLPGERLPSEHVLMRRFGATRAAVRRAIENLEARYLVRRSRGAGTFVNRRIDFELSTRHAPSLHETVQAAGAVARTFLIDITEEPPPAEVAAQLGLDANEPCVRLTRLGYIDDDPATYGVEWLVSGVLHEAVARLRAVESLAAALRDAGHDPVRVRTRASSEFAPRPVAERLQVAPPVPVWRLETLTRDGVAGRPLMFSRSWQRQDRIRLVIEFERAAEPA